VTTGDFTTAKVSGTFGLAYLVRNTIMNVTTQDGQVECFRNITAQRLISHHYWVDSGELETFSAPFRYVWPSELDLMARLAGMTLRERWSGWKREPFTSDSRSHISVWQKSPYRYTPPTRHQHPPAGPGCVLTLRTGWVWWCRCGRWAVSSA
jgi:hypothetical protein